ncbi:MAG: HisA/HisF-related TIM barrel protein [Thiotrichaceae bacterium]|nr:HisA/HisF-related TIM barrel protein [Thiotrichaceae bacterium]
MQIIPVLDLWQNQVVHARAGQRATYKPIQSKLCASSEAVEILKALVKNYPISYCYIADLNALQQQTPQIEIINNLARHFPHISFYVDSGLRTLADYEIWAAAYATQRIYPILGSETLVSFADYQQIRATAENSLLSLDFFQGQFLGDTALLENSESWTTTVILLNLHRVGTQSGIELAQLQQLQQRAPECAWIAAGGVRELKDLYSLQQQGAAGVLCATALHDLSLTPQNTACFFNT